MARKIWFRTLLVFLVALTAASHAQQLRPDLRIERIEDGIYVVTHAYPWPSNSVVLRLANSEVVLVDTPYTPDATQRLLEWVRQELRPRKITAINSHYHVDRLGGNAALIADGVPVYGSDHTARMVNERGAASLRLTASWVSDPQIRKHYEAFTLTAPDNLFREADALTLLFGDETIEVRFLGAGHSPDNLVVYYPAKQLLFAGCMVSAMPRLGNLTEADLKSWSRALDAIAAMPSRIVVPGHGGDAKSFTPALVEHTKALVSAELGKQSKQ